MTSLVEPVTRVRGRWVFLLVLANLSVWMGFFTPIQVLLPNQIEAIVPLHKESTLGLVTGIGALVAVFANPVAGALSDRTTGRFGRRHVWTVGGAVVAAVSLVLLAHQHTVLGVVVGWILAQAFLNTMLATLTAAVPDRVPVAQRGAVSGWVGIPQVLGVVLGVVLVTAVVTGTVPGYTALAVLVVLLPLPFALFTPDDRLMPVDRPRFSLRSFWISPRRHPDFAWAWGTRFLVQLGNALGTLYLLYFLKDRVKVANPDSGLLVLILIYTAALIATTVIAGRISDRTGKRKVFVIWSGVVIAIAAVMLAVWPVWAFVAVAAAVMGAGYGIYVAVDAALITQVLPRATDRAKDLGVINIANSAPQVLGPALSAPIVVHFGGYPVLYCLTAVVTLLGSVLVVRIRSVP